MCLAVLLTEGADIPNWQIRNAWANNSDGGGFAYIDREGPSIVMEKFMDVDDYIQAFRLRRSMHPDTPFMLHFRFATAGLTDLSNVHPFMMNESTAMCHNGVIKIPMYKDETRSDTSCFNDEILKRLPRDWLDIPEMVDMVEDYIGWSKMIFLSVDPDLSYEWYILNVSSGHWTDDKKVWYSNKSYDYATARHPQYGLYDSTKGVPTGKGTSSSTSSSSSSTQPATRVFGSGIPTPVYCRDNHTDWVYDDYCFKCEQCLECGGDGWDCECRSDLKASGSENESSEVRTGGWAVISDDGSNAPQDAYDDVNADVITMIQEWEGEDAESYPPHSPDDEPLPALPAETSADQQYLPI